MSTEPASGIPLGWPITDRPLRIAMLGWARLSFQGEQGSGYNLSASELASGLSLSGHQVFYLASGRRYDLRPGMHVRHTERWRNIECFDLYNSPNISPASYNFANMADERDHGRQNEAVLRWMDEHRIEVVHIHSLEGFPLTLIRRLRESGRAVIVTPHNYWYACPQVDLMRGETHLCRDYEGGTKCTGCMRSRPAAKTRLKRRLGQSVERALGFEMTGWLRQAAKDLPMRIAELRGRSRPDQPNAREPDPELAAGFDIHAPTGMPDDGLIRHNFRPERRDGIRKPVGRTELDENERFLNATHHLTVLNDYGRRRLEGIEALNHANLVTPPSDFVRRVYIRMGLDESRSRVVRLGQPHFDQINRRTRRSPYYDTRPWDPQRADRPLRFAYFGAMRPSKGIDVLAEAVPMLPREIRQRCQFHIRASGRDWVLRKRLSLFPEVSFAGAYDLLQLIGAGQEYDVGILPHVWFENSPLVMLEHLHAGKFIISSRLGGPPEWIKPPLNGLLVQGGYADQLAAAITRLVRGEVAIPSPREIHEATPLLQSYPAHVQELESIYRAALGEHADARIIVNQVQIQAPASVP